MCVCAAGINVCVCVCHASVCVCGESGDSDGGHAPVSVPAEEPQGAAHPRRCGRIIPRGSHYAHGGDGLLLAFTVVFTQYHKEYYGMSYRSCL